MIHAGSHLRRLGADTRKVARVIFDESHNETWTIDEQLAAATQPERPANSCYSRAASLLSRRDFSVSRNDKPITPELLANCDLFVIVHPSDPKWEQTVSNNSPVFSAAEIQAIHELVRKGGGLLIISEYENDKYGSNLIDLIPEGRIQIHNATVFNESSCHSGNASWVVCEPDTEENDAIATGIKKLCFYRAGACTASGTDSGIVVKAPPSAQARSAKGLTGYGFVARCQYGEGRVVVVTDSDLFGNEYISDADYSHEHFWLNICYWLSATAFDRSDKRFSIPVYDSEAWTTFRTLVEQLRTLQTVVDSERGHTSGEIDKTPKSLQAASSLVDRMCGELEGLFSDFPHQKEYADALLNDLRTWKDSAFGVPDFSKSLSKFRPELGRTDGSRFVSCFPMYTPNASLDRRFDALVFDLPWPTWLAQLVPNPYANDKFVPGIIVSHTSGYGSECAVLFPETVCCPKQKVTNHFGVIFCDREAKRFQKYVNAACSFLNLQLPPKLECYLSSLPLIRDSFALWDLIHDTEHSQGPLPFDPFMIRRRFPFWMYALEELRVDMASFCYSMELSESGLPFAEYVQYGVLFDRLIRFPISGPRTFNYDGLAGQILFGYLHKAHIVQHANGKLTIDWDRLQGAIKSFRDRLYANYEAGQNLHELMHWSAMHDFVAEFVTPAMTSAWTAEKRRAFEEAKSREYLKLVLPDEFPLNSFYSTLKREMDQMISG